MAGAGTDRRRCIVVRHSAAITTTVGRLAGGAAETATGKTQQQQPGVRGRTFVAGANARRCV